MPYYRAFADEWPEYADDLQSDQPVKKHNIVQDDRTPTPNPEEPDGAGRQRWSDSEDESSGPVTGSFDSPVTSDLAHSQDEFLQGFTQYAEDGTHRQHQKSDPQTVWIEITDDEDDVAVKEEPIPSDTEAPIPHQPPAPVSTDMGTALRALGSDIRLRPARAVSPFDPARPTVCSVCNCVFAHRRSMLRHYRHFHLHQNYACESCGQSFQRSTMLATHLLVCGLNPEVPAADAATPETSERDTVSSLNGVSEENELDVQSEQDSSIPPISYRKPQLCGICNRVYADRGTFGRHWKQVHLQIKPHQCHRCGSRFPRRDYMKKHLVTCNSESTGEVRRVGKRNVYY